MNKKAFGFIRLLWSLLSILAIIIVADALIQIFFDFDLIGFIKNLLNFVDNKIQI